MKTLTAVAFAASCCLVTFGSAAALTSNAAADSITCRIALENSNFVQVEPSNLAKTCCYVMEEQAWYNDHDVLLERFYQRQDSQIYLTKLCRTDLFTGGADNGVGGQSSSGLGGPPSSTPGNGPPSSVPGGGHGSSSAPGDDDGSSSASDGSSSSSSMSSEPPDDGGGLPGNPGNAKPVGGAGEAPNGDVSAFKPDPGTKGTSN